MTKNEVLSARQIQEKKTPLAVISSGIACNSDKEWARKQEDIKKITDNLVASDIVSKAPHQVWKTFEGRKAMEEALKELVKAEV